ncbi:MAG TPA: cyclic nucleotide-binding domain-containing protein [Anaeromyxobacter sp.]|nr:cyclic nucleotide-binding domain-containing protein [Anaeromyxobacter sp.]
MMTPQEPSAAEIYGRDFPAGAVVFDEGDPGSRMYVIVYGAVRIEKRVGSRSLTLAVLGPGEAFGEMALLEGAPRSASAVVERPSRILEIDEAAFEDLVQNNGEVALRLLRRLSARLREATRQIRNFLSADAMSRAVEVLRALAGPPGEDGFRVVPAEAIPERIEESFPPTRGEPALWERLRRARLVREVGGRAELAPAEVVEAYLRYAELKARFQALAAREVWEAGGLPGPADPAAELLRARLRPEGGLHDAAELRDLADYLDLARRFDVSEGS